MQFLSLYTPATPTPQPSPEHAAQMEALTSRMLATGELLLAGALGHREKAGLRITLKDGSYTVTEGPAGESVLMSAGGMSVSEAPSKDAFVAMIKEFLAIADKFLSR